MLYFHAINDVLCYANVKYNYIQDKIWNEEMLKKKYMYIY